MKFTEDEIFAGRYRLISKIGIGGFSEVWKVADQMANDAIVALKVYAPEKGLDEYGLKQFRREYSVVLNLNHQNLLTARYFDIHEGHPYLIVPFCEGGSVYGRIIEKGCYTEEELAEFLVQIAPAINYLHENEIVHQDIKSDNVLMDGKGNYLLMDFGISGKLRSTLRKSTTAAGSMTVAYAPPEKFRGMGVMSPESDVFSLGVMMIEMLTGDVPWNGMGGAYLKSDDDLPELPANFSLELRELIKSCLKLDVAERCSLKEITIAAKSKLEKGTWAYKIETSVSKPKGSGRKTIKKEDLGNSIHSGQKTQKVNIVGSNHANVKPKKKGKPLGLIIGIVAIIALGLIWFLMKPSSNTKPENDSIVAPSIAAPSIEAVKVNGVEFEMIDIDGGTFIMGCNSETEIDCNEFEVPSHSKTVGSFGIGRYEVTQAQWGAIMGNNPSEFSSCNNCPVEQVSWSEVQEFITKLNSLTGKNFRLPTEAEWEFAARGGNKSNGFLYSGGNSLNQLAWYNDNSTKKTHEVGQKQPNELGLFDMSGNVFEWCNDKYVNYGSSDVKNANDSLNSQPYVIRGGSWSWDNRDCRIYSRYGAGIAVNFVGFRLAY